MGLFDPTTRPLTRLGFELAGGLIGAFGRRGRVGSRRSPDRPSVKYAPRPEGDAVRQDPISATDAAQRAAWERFVSALENLTELQAVHTIDPDELDAGQIRWAEVELEDAVAVAGEFEVKNIRWLLT